MNASRRFGNSFIRFKHSSGESFCLCDHSDFAFCFFGRFLAMTGSLGVDGRHFIGESLAKEDGFSVKDRRFQHLLVFVY